MVWRINLEKGAKKDLANLDKPAARRIIKFLNDRISNLDNPRSIGESLKGSRLGAFWKYRIGTYRIIASIEDNTLTILVIRIGHRRDVYRKQ